MVIVLVPWSAFSEIVAFELEICGLILVVIEVTVSLNPIGISNNVTAISLNSPFGNNSVILTVAVPTVEPVQGVILGVGTNKTVSNDVISSPLLYNPFPGTYKFSLMYVSVNSEL